MWQETGLHPTCNTSCRPYPPLFGQSSFYRIFLDGNNSVISTVKTKTLFSWELPAALVDKGKAAEMSRESFLQRGSWADPAAKHGFESCLGSLCHASQTPQCTGFFLLGSLPALTRERFEGRSRSVTIISEAQKLYFVPIGWYLHLLHFKQLAATVYLAFVWWFLE